MTKRELTPHAVAARLERLRAIAPLETVDEARRRLAERPRIPFARAVAERLEELRALCELTARLHDRK